MRPCKHLDYSARRPDRFCDDPRALVWRNKQ